MGRSIAVTLSQSPCPELRVWWGDVGGAGNSPLEFTGLRIQGNCPGGAVLEQLCMKRPSTSGPNLDNEILNFKVNIIP